MRYQEARREFIRTYPAFYTEEGRSSGKGEYAWSEFLKMMVETGRIKPYLAERWSNKPMTEGKKKQEKFWE